MEDKMIASYEAGYELCLSFASLFNCDERTEEFFNNYGIYIKVHELANEFMANGGFIAFIKAMKAISIDSGEYISIMMLWPAIIAVTEIICIIANEQHNKDDLIEFSSIFVKRLWSISSDEIEVLTKNRHRLNKFIKNLKLILLLSLEKSEAEETFDKLKMKFSVLRAVPNILTLSNTQLITKENLQDEETLKFTVEMLKLQIEECEVKLNEIMEDKHIAEILKKRDEWLVPHKSCDKQEFECLNKIKTLIEGDRLSEAKKLIKWRKTILALAEHSGWELAKAVRDYTCSSMRIDTIDIIKVKFT